MPGKPQCPSAYTASHTLLSILRNLFFTSCLLFTPSRACAEGNRILRFPSLKANRCSNQAPLLPHLPHKMYVAFQSIFGGLGEGHVGTFPLNSSCAEEVGQIQAAKTIAPIIMLAWGNKTQSKLCEFKTTSLIYIANFRPAKATQ